ncbi:hypothetical protein [Lactiplantibacillus plantarum]|uniref:hypothetical protein n=1 Tax=Lactiplantibacillus plantarum TaxID=1590 RepID=UPI001BABADFE|nr:hypothetical protein [Lactiplantibacillus plantarum]MBS0936621.1 hypothetical protein [Lactiplantibacillus plantarum]MBS0943798.1 hypothetical protein [Lactiplantibacillus plantarum]
MLQPYTEAKMKANAKWDAKNPDRIKYLKAQSAARNFIRKRVRLEDIDELKQLIAKRESELK